MATVALPRTAATSGAVRERWFFVGMASAAVLIAIVGFVPRYFAPLNAGTLHVPTLVHVHGLTMWTWTLVFLAQTVLIATQRVRQHRLLGMAGIAVVTLCVYTGVSVALQQLDRQLAAGAGAAARQFVALPFSIAFMMPVLFAAAIVKARDRDAHARLMLLVTLVALQPALARLTVAVSGIGPPVNRVLASGEVLLLIGVAILHDVRVRGRAHPVLRWGGAFVLVVQLASHAFSDTPAWYAFTDRLLVLLH